VLGGKRGKERPVSRRDPEKKGLEGVGGNYIPEVSARIGIPYLRGDEIRHPQGPEQTRWRIFRV